MSQKEMSFEKNAAEKDLLALAEVCPKIEANEQKPEAESIESLEMIVASSVKKSTSSFLRSYRANIVQWADYLNDNAKNILAISRKGPRLIEILHEAGFINNRVFHNTFSEHALPFLGEMTELTIVDDSVFYGSTVNKILHLSEQYLKIDREKVDIVPVRYSEDTPDVVKNRIKRNVSVSIDKHKTMHHIRSLISSFKSLGKPYDIEHPITYLRGDFGDTELLKVKLEEVNDSISQYPLIVNDSDNFCPPSYTMLLNSEGTSDSSDFSKFRIYVNAELTRLAIVPISLTTISNDDTENLCEIIDPVFVNIWEMVCEAVNRTDEPECLSKHSLVVFANYLNSLGLLLSRMPLFGRYFNQKEMSIDVFDLQILLGAKLANSIASELNDLIVKEFDGKPIESIQKPTGCVKKAVFPTEHEVEYNGFLKNRISTLRLLNDEFEIINMIFVAQHYKVDMPSRNGNQYDNPARLEFGVSLQYIVDRVQEIKSDYSIINVHSALDKLIDCGTIVPKYVNVSAQENQVIWRRVFRVGEGSPPTIQRILTVGCLLKKLPDDYLHNGIPATVLEKLLVIALTDAFHFDALQEECISGLGIKRKFGLYGARSYFEDSSGGGHYLLDWLVAHEVLMRNPNNDTYKINKTIFDSQDYWADARNELGIAVSAQDKLEDVANFCCTVSSKINSDALVSITSLSTEQEYWQAISAELYLWLKHPKYNVYNCISKLDALSFEPQNGSLMRDCNFLLAENANFTAQVSRKKELFEKFDKDILKIGGIVERSDTSVKRVWRDIKDVIDKKRGQSRAAFNNDVLSVLRISHITTSVCRTLLNKAGNKCSKSGIPKSIGIYLNSLLNTINESPNLISNHFQNKGILEELRTAIINYDDTDDFSKIYQKLRKLLGNIVIACDNLYELVATEPKQYFSKPLNPPVYVVMWDMRASTSVPSRNDVEEKVIFPINEKIKMVLKNNRHSLHVFEESSDDGNCFLTTNFNDVISAFTIITGIAKENNVTFRMGCDVNYEGELHVYTSLKKNIFAGRVFEYAARITSLYKEVQANPSLWLEGLFNCLEPDTSYLLISEFAKRKACSDGQWNFSDINIATFDGEYLPRVKPGTSIPYKVFQLTAK